MGIKFDWKKINIKKLWQHFFNFIFEKRKLILFVALFFLVGYCVYIWYIFVYSYSWSEDEKQRYMKTKDAGTIFDKAKFNEIVSESEKRDSKFKSDIGNPKDIFRLE